MAASCFSMATTQVLPSLEAAATPTSLGGGSACLKAPSSRLPMMALPKAAPCHSGMSLARHGISCLAPVLARRRLLRFRALAQDSSLAAQVVEEEQDTPLAQTEEEEEDPPASGVLEGEARGEQSEEQLGGIQAVQDVAIVPESKAEQESVGDQDYPPLPEGTKLYVGNLPFDVDSEGLAKLFDESGVVEMVEAPTYRRLLPQFCKLQLARKLQLPSIFCRHQLTGGSNLNSASYNLQGSTNSLRFSVGTNLQEAPTLVS